MKVKEDRATPGNADGCEKKGDAGEGLRKLMKRGEIRIGGGEGGIWKLLKRKGGEKLLRARDSEVTDPSR